VTKDALLRELDAAPVASKLENIPAELRQAAQWLQYYLKTDPKRPDKKPGKQPIVKWGTPEDRKTNLRSLDYLLEKRAGTRHHGFQRYIDAAEGFVFIDLDRVRDPVSGDVKPWAADIITRLGTYCEVSGSGRGFHLVARGRISADHHRDGDPVELYGGHTGKLMAMTGDVHEINVMIETRQEQLDDLYRRTKAGEFAVPEPTVAESLDDGSGSPWVIRNVPRIDQLPRGEQKWVIDNLLPFAGLAMLSGKQGSQKSLLAMFLAQGISGRSHCLGRCVLSEQQRFGAPVLYLDRENPVAEVNKRREKIGILGNQDFRYWGDWELEHVPEPDDPRLMQFAKAGGYLIFDSLQQWYGDRNENDNTAMLELMNKFKALARAGAGVLLLHHNAKPLHRGGDSQSRGGTAIVACTDMAISASKNGDGIVQLREDRFRMCAPWEIDYKVSFDYSHDAYPGRAFYAFEVLRDDDAAAAARFHKQEQEAAAEEKRKEKDAQDTPLRNRLLTMVKENPEYSPRTLERKTNQNGKGIGRKRIETLLGQAKYVYKNESWHHQGTTPGIFDGDVESFS
jgi:hypothetical protein